MKFNPGRFSFGSACNHRLAALIAASLCCGGLASGANQTWKASPTDANWATATNWVGGAAPGNTNAATANVVNADVVTFNTALSGGIGGSSNPIVIDANRIIKGITFDTSSVGAFVIGSSAGNTLNISHTGSIQMTSGVTSAQTIAANTLIRLPSSTNGTYSFTNNATDTGAILTFTGSVTSGSASTRPVALTLDGSNTGANLVSGVISHGAGQQINLIKDGAGTWTLSAANDFGSNTSATNAGSTTLNNGLLIVKNASALSTNSTANATAVNLNGGVLEIANTITLDNGLSLNLNNGGTIRSNGTNGTNGRINVGAAASTSVTLTTSSSSDVFTIGNGTNDLTGGAADSIINISGAGTVFQNVASNYAGGWSINSGTLRLGSATALGVTTTSVAFGPSSTGKLQLNGNSVTIGSLSSNATPGSPVVENGVAGTSTLTVSGSSSTTYAGVLQNGSAGILALTKSGSGTLNLTGSNLYTGATTVSGGILKVNNGSGTSATGTGNVSVASSATLGGAGFISGGVTVASGGIVAPGNSVGTLTVGSLSLANGSILNFEFNGTPANDYVNVTSSGGLTLNGGGFNLYQEGTLTAFNTVGTYNLFGYSGSIGGTGTSALSVLNPQSGKTYIFGSNGSQVTLNIGVAGVVSNWNVDADSSWGSSGNWANGVPNSQGDTAIFNATLTASRSILLDGTRTVGGLTFDGGSSSFGYNIVSGTGGSLVIDNGVSQASIIVSSGANTIAADVSLNSTNTVASVAVGSALGISGSIGGTGNLVKSGAGMLDLTNTTNTYSGNTSVTGGTLGFSALGSLGSGSLTIDGGTLRYDSGNTADISGKSVTIGAGGAQIDTNGNDVTYTSAIGNSGTGGITKLGSGKLSLASGNTFTGASSLIAGTLNLASDTSLGAVPGSASTNLTINPGTGNTATLQAGATFSLNANRSIVISSGTAIFDTQANNLTVGGVISGSGVLNKAGSGNLTLNGAGTYASTVVDAGTVIVGNNSALGSGSVTLNGTSSLNLGARNLANALVVNGTNGLTSGDGGGVSGLNTITGSGSLTVTISGGNVDLRGNLTGFNGSLAIANTGTFRFNGTGGSGTFALDLANGSAFVRNSATGITLGALSGGASSSLNGAGGGATQAVTYTIGGLNTNTTFSGSINNGSNTTSLTKVGSGSLTLAGTNTYSGATTVSSGTLLVTGALGNSAVSVTAGTLGGTGTIGGSVTVSGTSTYAPGASPGSLEIAGDLTLGTNTTTSLELGGTAFTLNATEEYDRTKLTGSTATLNLGGTLDVSLYSNFVLAANQAFGIFQLESGATRIGTFTGLGSDGDLVGNFGGTDLYITYSGNFSDSGTVSTFGGNDIVLYTVPEPATALLGALGLLRILRRRRP